MGAPVFQAEGTKVPSSNHVDIACQKLQRDGGPYALQACVVISRHTFLIRTLVPCMPPWHTKINPRLQMSFDMIQLGADGVTTDNLHFEHQHLEMEEMEKLGPHTQPCTTSTTLYTNTWRWRRWRSLGHTQPCTTSTTLDTNTWRWRRWRSLAHHRRHTHRHTTIHNVYHFGRQHLEMEEMEMQTYTHNHKQHQPLWSCSLTPPAQPHSQQKNATTTTHHHDKGHETNNNRLLQT